MNPKEHMKELWAATIKIDFAPVFREPFNGR